jgi:hypothetical protein
MIEQRERRLEQSGSAVGVELPPNVPEPEPVPHVPPGPVIVPEPNPDPEPPDPAS